MTDIEKIKAEIERLKKEHYNTGTFVDGVAETALNRLLSFIELLEKEPKVELDFQRFSKEMDAVLALPASQTENTAEEPLNWEYAIAKHFYELGKKDRKED